ncbi:hypothetical protein Lpp123_08402, partial [Lacticaseibacillus paracasei subsp. paracasei Lpp123]
ATVPFSGLGDQTATVVAVVQNQVPLRHLLPIPQGKMQTKTVNRSIRPLLLSKIADNGLFSHHHQRFATLSYHSNNF